MKYKIYIYLSVGNIPVTFVLYLIKYISYILWRKNLRQMVLYTNANEDTIAFDTNVAWINK